ncbi:glycosyltransferase [Chloroflexota bacterium]
MQVVFLPFTAQQNPYQQKLSQALAPFGVDIHAPGQAPLQSLLNRRIQGKLDLVHIHWVSPLLLGAGKGASILKSSLFILTCLALRAGGVKLVWSVHNLLGHESCQPGLEIFARKILYRICNHVIVHCPGAGRAIRETYQLPQQALEKITIIPHGHYINDYANKISPLAARRRLGLPTAGRSWLYFGLIRPYKNVSALIETFKQIEGDNLSLIIAGEPQDEQLKSEIQRQIASHRRIQARLEFIPDDEIQTYMNAADLAVLPFRTILTSSSIMLAMSYAKAVVTPAIGCSPHILSQQRQLLYDPQSKTGLRDRLLASREMDLDRIGRHNLEIVRRFPWELTGQKTYELYRR